MKTITEALAMALTAVVIVSLAFLTVLAIGLGGA